MLDLRLLCRRGFELVVLPAARDRDIEEALDGQALGGVDEGDDLVLRHADLPAVHVPHQQLHDTVLNRDEYF